jgi:predicted glycosyltransferase
MSARLLIYNGLGGEGLGHRERVLKIATAFTAELPGAQVLLATAAGEGLAGRLPPRVEVLALAPGGVARGPGRVELLTPGDLVAMHAARAGVIRDAAARFQPDLVLVEHSPAGVLGELLETFDLLGAARRPPKLVLGLREIICEPPPRVHKAWEDEGIYGEIASRYDRVLVYGSECLLASASRYGYAEAAAGKLRYCGYVGPVHPIGRGSHTGDGTIVVTGGGGAFGYPMMSRCVPALRSVSERRRVIFVTGPRMDSSDRDALVALASGSAIEVRANEERMSSLLATADLAICLGGYNTLTEALAARCRVLVMPRTWTGATQAREAGQTNLPISESEQLLRIELFAQLGLIEVVEPAAGPDEIAATVERALATGAPEPCELPLDGAARAARELLELLELLA